MIAVTLLCISDFDGKKDFRKFIEDPEKSAVEGSFKICRRGVLDGVKRVAITFFKKVDSIDANNEIKTIRRIAGLDIRSLHIVRALGFSKLCIVFEECDANLCETHKRDPDIVSTNVRKIFIGILNAIEFLHGNNLAHRDIKPANVLINRLENNTLFPLLGDLGDVEVANSVEALNLVGTPDYLAPEAFQALSTQSCVLPEGTDPKKLDIWAAGLMFWNLANNIRVPEHKPPMYKRRGQPSSEEAVKFGTTYMEVTAYYQDFEHPLFAPMLNITPSLRATASQALAWFELACPQDELSTDR